MGLTLTDFHIPEKAYITKKLDHNTIAKLLDSSSFVVDGIYMIKNNLDLNIKLFEQDKVGPYKISAYVKMDYAYAGKARAQIKNIKPFKALSRRKPGYKFRISLYNEEHQSIYSFSQKYTRINQLMDSINLQYMAINQFLQDHNIETK